MRTFQKQVTPIPASQCAALSFPVAALTRRSGPSAGAPRPAHGVAQGGAAEPRVRPRLRVLLLPSVSLSSSTPPVLCYRQPPPAAARAAEGRGESEAKPGGAAPGSLAGPKQADASPMRRRMAGLVSAGPSRVAQPRPLPPRLPLSTGRGSLCGARGWRGAAGSEERDRAGPARTGWAGMAGRAAPVSFSASWPARVEDGLAASSLPSCACQRLGASGAFPCAVKSSHCHVAPLLFAGCGKVMRLTGVMWGLCLRAFWCCVVRSQPTSRPSLCPNHWHGVQSLHKKTR